MSGKKGSLNPNVERMLAARKTAAPSSESGTACYFCSTGAPIAGEHEGRIHHRVYFNDEQGRRNTIWPICTVAFSPPTPTEPSDAEREADWLILEVGMEPPKHECEFITNPEKGACEFHERWVSAYEAAMSATSRKENE